jgi:hypothetical protein
MSYDADFENTYMVEFFSGRTIHVSFFDAEEVIQYCEDKHEKETIKMIYKEVYVAEEEAENG